MKILAFSDVHRDLDACAGLVGMAGEVDLVIGAGDFASVHEGLDETIEALSPITTETVLVPGNNEGVEDLRDAVSRLWPAATVLHGDAVEVMGVPVYGLGGGVPVTPWEWSFDLDEGEAAEMLEALPDGALLVVHSPPKGHCDQSSGGEHLGSTAILEAIERTSPKLAVCGHIHEAWGERSTAGSTEVVNLGPSGTLLEVG